LKCHVVALTIATITFLCASECFASGAAGCIDKVEDLWFNRANQQAAIDTLEACVLSGRLARAEASDLEQRVFPRMLRWFSVKQEAARFTEIMVHLAQPKNRAATRRVFGATELWQYVEKAYADYDTPNGEPVVLPKEVWTKCDSTIKFDVLISNRLGMPLYPRVEREVTPEGAGDFNRETKEFKPYQDGDATLTIWPVGYPDLKKSVQIHVQGPQAPTIGKFSPEEAFPGQAVWIYGTGFKAWEEAIEIQFGRVAAEYAEIYADSILVFVPAGVGEGPVTIGIKYSNEPPLTFEEKLVVLPLTGSPSKKRALAVTGTTLACGGGAAVCHSKKDEDEYKKARNVLFGALGVGAILTVIEWRRYWSKGKQYKEQVEKLHACPLVRFDEDRVAVGLTLRF
jgi:hypothetical protein